MYYNMYAFVPFSRSSFAFHASRTRDAARGARAQMYIKKFSSHTPPLRFTTRQFSNETPELLFLCAHVSKVAESHACVPLNDESILVNRPPPWNFMRTEFNENRYSPPSSSSTYCVERTPMWCSDASLARARGVARRARARGTA